MSFPSLRSLLGSFVNDDSSHLDPALEEFKEHCRIAVLCFYDDSIVELNRLNAVKLELVAESRALKKAALEDNVSAGHLGSRGEHFVKCRLLDLIADIARVTEPAGLVKWALDWTAEVIEDMPDFLFAHTSVSKPLLRLLSVSLSEPTSLLRFLDVLVHRLKQAPQLSRLFLIEPSEPSHELKFAPFRLLAELYKDPKLKTHVTRLLLVLVQFCGDEALDTFSGTKMSGVLIEDLVYHFQEIAPFLTSNSLNMGPYLKHLELIATILSCNHYVAFKAELLRQLRKSLIKNVVAPRMFESDLLVVNASVVYFREVLLHLGPRSPAAHEFIRFLFRGTDLTDEKASPELVLNRLVSFITRDRTPVTHSDQSLIVNVLAANTMRLFSTIFTFKVKYGTLAGNFIHRDIVSALHYERTSFLPQQRRDNLERLVALCGDFDVENSREYEHALRLAKSSALKYATSASSHEASMDSPALQPRQAATSLISALIESLSKFDVNGLEFNLYLTDAIGKLALIVDEDLHAFLLDDTRPLLPLLEKLSAQYSASDALLGARILSEVADDGEDVDSEGHDSDINAALFREVLHEVVTNLHATELVLNEGNEVA